MPYPSPGEMTFGQALKALLAAAGLTPDGVLTELGDRRLLVSRTSLYDWMKNSHLPEEKELSARRESAREAPAAGLRASSSAMADGWRSIRAMARASRLGIRFWPTGLPTKRH